MKKSLIFALLLMVSLTGCSMTNNESADGATNESNSRRNMPDFERPEEEPSLSGLVQNIVGNEVSILEVDRGNRDMSAGSDEDQDDSAPVATLGTGTGGGMGPGAGMNGGQRPDMDEDQRLEMLKSMATGEKKVIIPVGIKMLKNEDGEMVEASLLDVSANSMLMIWLNDDIEDRNVAEFVIIN